MVTYYRLRLVFSRLQCKGSVIILSILWILGLFFGLHYASTSGDIVSTQLSIAPYVRPSFAGLFTVLMIPVVVSAIAIHYRVPALIYIYCAFKAFTFGLSLIGIVTVFGRSSWLIRFFLLFSDSGITVVFLWLWHSFLSAGSCSIRNDLLICTAASFAIVMFDYYFVSPYLVVLMNYS